MTFPFFTMFRSFLTIGAFTIGGGWAMVPLIQREVVERKKWITDAEFLDLLAIAQSLPGLLALNISIFVGYRIAKLRGSLVCGLGAVLPSFLIILTIAYAFAGFKDNAAVIAVFKGIRPAVVALILVPTFTTAKSAKINRSNIYIPIAVALSIAFLNASPVYIILGTLILSIGLTWRKGKRVE